MSQANNGYFQRDYPQLFYFSFLAPVSKKAEPQSWSKQVAGGGGERGGGAEQVKEVGRAGWDP